MKTRTQAGILAATALVLSAPAFAHVPYIERSDYSAQSPRYLREIEQSKAVYAWLQDASDIDYYTFNVDGPTELFVQSLVPVCDEYAEFRPSFAIIGPGLPVPDPGELPIELPPDYGAFIFTDGEPGDPRNSFYEPFGDKFYYEGPTFREEVTEPGLWGIIFWDPAEVGGDYVATVGTGEYLIDRYDFYRSIYNTMIIRNGGELHTDCR